jgi:hypothetical protein
MSRELQYTPVSNDGGYASESDPEVLTDHPLTTHINSKVPRILLTGLATSVSILLVASGLLIRILVAHDFYIKSDSLVTTASLGPTITIAHVCSVLVSATVPLLLGLAAYNLSRDWLAASRTGGDNRPTPFQ